MASIDAEAVAENAIVGTVSVVTISALLFLFGFDVSFGQAFWVLIAFMAFGVFARRQADISIGFAIVTIAIIFLLSDFVLPSWLTEPFTLVTVVIRSLTGINLGEIDSVTFAVLSVTFVALMLAVRVRLTGEAKTFRPIIDRVGREFLRYINVYLNTARLAALFLVGVIAIALQQFAQLSGEIGVIAQEVPFVVTNIIVTLGGYLSLGGTLPVIGSIPILGSLTAAEILFLGIILMGTAAAVRWRSSGPLAQAIEQILGR